MDKKRLSLEEWLDLAASKNLKEEDYALLIHSLPEDENKKTQWLNELKTSSALNEMKQNNSEWIDLIQSKLKVQKKRRRSNILLFKMGGVAALVMVSFVVYLSQSPVMNKRGKGVAMEEDLAPVAVVKVKKKKRDIEKYYDKGGMDETDLRAPIVITQAEISVQYESAVPTKSIRFAEDSDSAIVQNERYHSVPENKNIHTQDDNKSTFSIDVDTASYANIRRMIKAGSSPNPKAVRIEEMINYFDYDYPQAKENEPFSVNMEMTQCPWNQNNKVLKVGLKGRIDENRPDVNLVFLLDVSGSMNSHDKLPLLKNSFSLLLDNLKEKDSVAIVAYAGRTGVVLDSTSASNKHKIMQAIRNLKSSGSTNGVGGIQLAYQLAQKNFSKKGVNRVILATDGDFNVGISNRQQLIDFIAKKRETGIELSVLGFGKGNIRDDIMEGLANKGNGNYNYIDSLREARKALVSEMSGTLVTIAKDVKIQMEFNSEAIKSFRLIGYENRKLAHKDFADDKKDAGEIGMGHTVTALYEIVPSENFSQFDEILKLNLRYKAPKGEKSKLLTYSKSPATTKPSKDMLWALAVASWGQILRQSEHLQNFKLAEVLKMSKLGRGDDNHGYRAEMIQLIQQYMDQEKIKGSGEALPRWEFRK